MPLCSENVYFFKKCAPCERCCPAVQRTVELNQLPDWKVKKQKQLWRNGETAPEKCSFTNFPRHEENKFN